jgi:anaerobic dimethyl sulfoxide reductase subunit A
MADDIKSEVLKRLGINYGKYYSERDKKTELDIMKAQWEGAKINPHYLQNVDPSATLPDFETFRKKGIFQLNVPRDKSVIGVSQYATSGVFPTDTGKINFISPYYYYRDKDLGEKYKKRDGGYYRSLYPPKPMYVEPVYGYEQIHEGKYIGLKGLSYSLQLVTAHHRRRAHSVYDNVAILKDQFPGIVDINEIDATQRGIKQDDVVYVYNDWGCVKVKANVTKRIIKGTCRIADGEWYRPSLAEIYTIAWKDYNSKGKSEDRFGKYDVVRKEVPVDVGGAPNTLMHDIDVGFKDPALGAFSSFDNSWNGHLVEISKIFPGDK